MDKWLNLDRRIIFAILVAALVVVSLLPFKQPIEPSRQVRAVFDAVEALPDGSAVMLSLDFDPQAAAELSPMTLAVLSHCFRKGHRILGLTFWPEGELMGNALFAQAGEQAGKEAGTHYAFLGFKPGGQVAVITSLGESISTTFSQDFEERPTSGMAAFEGVSTLRDVGLIIDIAAGSSVEPWVAYGSDKYGVEMAAGCTAVIGPDLYPYAHSGQLTGIIGGLRGVADYETLLGEPGSAVKGMPAQSVSHGIIIAFVILGNVLFFLSRRSPKEGAGS